MSLEHVNQTWIFNRFGTWENTAHISKAGWCQCFCDACTSKGKHNSCICGWCQNCPDRPEKEDA